MRPTGPVLFASLALAALSPDGALAQTSTTTGLPATVPSNPSVGNQGAQTGTAPTTPGIADPGGLSNGGASGRPSSLSTGPTGGTAAGASAGSGGLANPGGLSFSGANTAATVTGTGSGGGLGGSGAGIGSGGVSVPGQLNFGTGSGTGTTTGGPGTGTGGGGGAGAGISGGAASTPSQDDTYLYPLYGRSLR